MGLYLALLNLSTDLSDYSTAQIEESVKGILYLTSHGTKINRIYTNAVRRLEAELKSRGYKFDP